MEILSGVFLLPQGVVMENCKVWVKSQRKLLDGFIGESALYLVVPTHAGFSRQYCCELDDVKSLGVTIYPG